MKKLSDFQNNHQPRTSISEGISIDTDEQSLSERSNSQHSVEDESMDDSSVGLSNDKTNHITVKVSRCLLSDGHRQSISSCDIQFAIKEVRDLPQCDAEHVMCRYSFINQKQDQTIVSVKASSKEENDDDEEATKKPRIFTFNHEKVLFHTDALCWMSMFSVAVGVHIHHYG